VQIIPAVDIKDGRCVRLVQGDPERETVYSDSPVEQAKWWESFGVELLHVVDLDGAFSGEPRNLDVIEKIKNETSIDIEVGGGIRDLQIVRQYVNIGVNRIIIGSAAIKNKDFVEEACKEFPGKIIVGIDVVDENVAIHGWKDVTDVHYYHFSAEMKKIGVSEIILTDISKDGMLGGVDVHFYEKSLEKIGLPIIASGGVSSIDDIKNLMPLSKKGLKGVITGKAIYDKKLDLKEAMKVINAG